MIIVITLLLFLVTKAIATVTVLMDDVASIFEAPPSFEHAFYTFEVDENQIFEHFGRVQAHHKAAERRGSTDRLWYILDRRSEDASLFRVDTESGWLSNRITLDAEGRRRYTVRVLACLESHTSLCGGTDVVVLTRDVNDNAPQFNRSTYDVRVPLNLPAGTELVRVGAHDLDLPGSNSEISYSLRVPNSFQDLFEIDAKTGVISLARRFDTARENVAVGLQYRIEVDATDSGQPPQSSSATVLIHTDTINPTSPVFEKFRYEVTLDAPIAAHTEIVRVRASDPDPGADGRVHYRFADFDEQTHTRVSQQFGIDSTTGRIFTLTSVERPLSQVNPNHMDSTFEERDHAIQLVVDGIDGSPDFSRRSQTVVVIYLRSTDNETTIKLESNDCEIEFIPLPNTIYISSAKPAGANIMKLSVRSRKGKSIDANHITYTIDALPVTSEAAMHFELRADQLAVRHQLAPGEFDLQLTACRDNCGAIATHVLHVVVMRNREKYPVFDRLNYDVKVDANALFPLHVPSFNASLLTGRIEYSIYSSGVNFASTLNNNVIFVDKITGDLTIFEELLQFAEKADTSPTEIFLVVRARNVDFPRFYSDVGVRLEIINRHSSQFVFISPLYRFETIENTPVGTVISGDVALGISGSGSIARQSAVRYFFEPASPLFGVLANGSVIVMRALDAEQLAMQRVTDANGVLNLNVIAESDEFMTYSKVQIAIIDVDEYAPKFNRANYTFAVGEDSTVPIGRVAASDMDVSDRQLKYHLKSGEATKYYTVDEVDGTLRQKYAKSIDHEYSMLVEVEDSGGKTDTTTVVITPKYNDMTWRPTKSGKPERFAIALASDKRWQFRIAGGNEHGHFSLRQFNDSTAELEMLSLPSAADKFHAKRSEFDNSSSTQMETIRVEATNMEDARDIAHRNVSIDLQGIMSQHDNNEFHFIDDYNIENVIGNEERLITVNFTDLHLDGNGDSAIARIRAGYGNMLANDVQYSLVGVGESIFRVDPSSGVLYVNFERLRASGANLREEEFELLVQAEALGSAKSARRVYVVRFNEPANLNSIDFNSTVTTVTFQVTPTVAPMSSIVTTSTVSTVSAFLRQRFDFIVTKPRRDQLIGQLAMRDSTLFSLSIEPPKFRNWFVVDPRTRLLFIRQVPMNLSGRQRAEFQVVAQEENGAISSANITIDLILTTNTEEKTTVGSPIVAAFSTDDTSHLMDTMSAASSLEVNAKIQAETLTTTLPTQMSGERFTLNDNDATIERETEYANIVTVIVPKSEEPIDKGNDDETIKTSSDIPINGQDNTSQSKANAKSDEFETIKSDHENGTKPLTKVLPVTKPKSRLQFATRRFTAMLPEGNYGTHGASVRLRPAALSKGQPQNAVYAMADDASASLPFFIRNETGELIAFAEIDRECISKYRFNVTTTIPGSKQNEVAEVEVIILDVNDNFPRFVDLIEDALVRAVAIDLHRTLTGQRLARFHAEDNDEGAAGHVTYQLNEDRHQLFRIDERTGELFLTNAVPDNLPQVPINLKIVASDGGRPALRVTHDLRVDVFRGDQSPHFPQREYNATSLAADAGEAPVDAGMFVAQLLAGVPSLHYSINGQSSDLFRIDDQGIVRLNRRPMDAEFGRNYALNVFAAAIGNSSRKVASTMLHVFLPSRQLSTTLTTTAAPATSPAANPIGCDFETKVFCAEIRENTAGRRRLTQLKTRGCEELDIRFVVHQGGNTNDFALDARTGEFFTLKALDRERKSLHIIIINVTTSEEKRGYEGKDARLRRQSQAFIPIDGYAKNKLTARQAMIVIRVLDENDNPPVFTGLNSNGVYVFSVDAHVPLLVPFARILASDADEKATNNMSYSLGSLKSDYFTVNATTGHVATQRELVDLYDSVVDVEVAATDGLHESRVLMKIHIIRPGVNAVVLTSRLPIDRLDNTRLASNLTRALNIDTRVLASQVFVDEQRRADSQRTHVIVYALERGTHVPLSGERLKSILENRLATIPANASDAEMLISLYHIANNITLPPWAIAGGQLPFHLSWLEVALYTFGGVIAILTCTLVFVCLHWCKKRQIETKSDMEYMVGSELAGPRPYNVELLTRKMAQDMLGRALPDPHEEVTLSPESRATMIASSSVYASRAENVACLTLTNSSAVDSHSVAK